MQGWGALHMTFTARLLQLPQWSGVLVESGNGGKEPTWVGLNAGGREWPMTIPCLHNKYKGKNTLSDFYLVGPKLRMVAHISWLGSSPQLKLEWRVYTKQPASKGRPGIWTSDYWSPQLHICVALCLHNKSGQITWWEQWNGGRIPSDSQVWRNVGLPWEEGDAHWRSSSLEADARKASEQEADHRPEAEAAITSRGLSLVTYFSRSSSLQRLHRLWNSAGHKPGTEHSNPEPRATIQTRSLPASNQHQLQSPSHGKKKVHEDSFASLPVLGQRETLCVTLSSSWIPSVQNKPSFNVKTSCYPNRLWSRIETLPPYKEVWSGPDVLWLNTLSPVCLTKGKSGFLVKMKAVGFFQILQPQSLPSISLLSWSQPILHVSSQLECHHLCEACCHTPGAAIHPDPTSLPPYLHPPWSVCYPWHWSVMTLIPCVYNCSLSCFAWSVTWRWNFTFNSSRRHQHRCQRWSTVVYSRCSVDVFLS